MGYTIRLATPEDSTAITRHRYQMFVDMGLDPEVMSQNVYGANFEGWVRQKIGTGEYVGWLCVDDRGEVAAGAGLWLLQWFPSLNTPNLWQAYVMNVYTEPTHRRHGLARKLMDALLEDCRRRGLNKVTLHASDQGRPLYESLGFEATNEMRLNL